MVSGDHDDDLTEICDCDCGCTQEFECQDDNCEGDCGGCHCNLIDCECIDLED